MLGGGGNDVTGRPARLAAPTLIRLSSSRVGLPEGEELALAAQVLTVSGGEDDPRPTGSVRFCAGGQLLGSAPVDGRGQAVLAGVRLPPGLHAITAAYPGDPHHAAATSSPLPQAVTVPAGPVVVLVSAPASTPDGVRLEAEVVDPRSGRLAEDATGTVVFTVGGNPLAAVALMGGHARAVVVQLPPGRLAAAFAGDTEHAAAVGLFLEPVTGS